MSEEMDDKNIPESNSAESSPDSAEQVDEGKRNFLKLGVAGAGVAAAAAGGALISHKLEGTPLDDIVAADEIAADFKPFDQRNMILTFAGNETLNKQFPERKVLFNKVLKKENPDHPEFDFIQDYKAMRTHPVRDEPGYTQLDKALQYSTVFSWNYMSPGEGNGQPGAGILNWDQSRVAKQKYKFASKDAAKQAIKSAARLYGAHACGIARFDRRFVYEPMYDKVNDKTLSWDKDLPFEPKSVIVMLWEMDYHCMATAPAWTADATVAEAYTRQATGAAQMAQFLKGLGHHAIGAGNDMANSVAYGVLAGLGEGARNGHLIAPEVGCRVRISKVFTDFDFFDYDQPRDFGVKSFCENCKRCADSCPSKAISFDDKPSLYPTYSDNKEDTWNNLSGIYKFHSDAKKCFLFWTQNGSGCAACIASCPYNKPDFWHHRFIDAQNVIAPGWVHSIMREMDIVFGYGNVADPEKVKKFWKTGSKS
jgi:reductive dehalogenase